MLFEYSFLACNSKIAVKKMSQKFGGILVLKLASRGQSITGSAFSKFTPQVARLKICGIGEFSKNFGG